MFIYFFNFLLYTYYYFYLTKQNWWNWVVVEIVYRIVWGEFVYGVRLAKIVFCRNLMFLVELDNSPTHRNKFLNWCQYLFFKLISILNINQTEGINKLLIY
uniref:Uncharacterized protein n=1 Tax=Cacopsylla melanoneura TaxID=428564 RepID=A0A8D8WZM5_9HEMI